MSDQSTLKARVLAFLGSRGNRAAAAIEDIADLSSRDLSSLLILLSESRAAAVTPADAVRHSRFHRPSPVSPRILHAVEDVILAVDHDTEYVDLSPLQPFGVNAALTGISQKNVVGTVRRSEANADATTALFTECLDREEETVRLATFCRSVRAQSFPEGSPLLPHFKTWASVSTGRHGESDGLDHELTALADHLAREVRVLDRVLAEIGVPGTTLKISISNVLLSRALAEAGLIEVPHVEATRPGSLEPIEPDVPFAEHAEAARLRAWGLDKGTRVTELFRDVVVRRCPDLVDRLVLDLHRRYGVGYYQHVCYKIGAGLPDGTRVPLADGGTTDWATAVTGSRRRYVVTSGIGTELLARHVVDPDRVLGSR